MPRGRNAGFSLLEVLLAVGVLAVGLSMLMYIFTQSARAAEGVRIRNDLHLLAQMRMSQIEVGELDPNNVIGEGSFDRKPGYVWSVAVSDTDPVGLLQRVSVTVRWVGPDSDQDGPELTLTRLMALADASRSQSDAGIALWPAGSPIPAAPKAEDILSAAGGGADPTSLLNQLLGGMGAGGARGGRGGAGGAIPAPGAGGPGGAGPGGAGTGGTGTGGAALGGAVPKGGRGR